MWSSSPQQLDRLRLDHLNLLAILHTVEVNGRVHILGTYALGVVTVLQCFHKLDALHVHYASYDIISAMWLVMHQADLSSQRRDFACTQKVNVHSPNLPHPQIILLISICTCSIPSFNFFALIDGWVDDLCSLRPSLLKIPRHGERLARSHQYQPHGYEYHVPVRHRKLEFPSKVLQDPQ